MNTATKAMLAFWESPRNIPFKGSLISDEPINDGEEPTTCMCAQGQVLHLQAGYTEEDLRDIVQEEADREVAKLLGISTAHSVLLRKINDSQDGAPSDVLTNPQKYLGPNWNKVLEFWHKLDSLNPDQWRTVTDRYRNLDFVAGNAARDAARDAARGAAWFAAGSAAWSAPYDAAGAAAGSVAEYATEELISGIENQVFVPLFDDL
jgi:hypothetical protein